MQVLSWLKKIFRKIPPLHRYFRQREIERAYQQVFSSPIRHEMLVADKIRTQLYDKAIRRHVKPGQVVLDLGAGTGLLSFLASRQNPKVIHAVDRSPILNLAKKVAEANGIQSVVFTSKDSREFSIREKADVIIHDQIGDFLFNENMLTSVLDWRDRLLKPGGRILPSRFELYLEPVQIKDDFHAPFLYENKINGIDFSCLKNEMPSIDTALRLEFDQIDRYFSEPEKVLEIDLETLKTVPKNIAASKTILEDGRLDGLFLYFKIIFDEQTSLIADFSYPWLNWTRQLLRCESMPLRKGQQLKIDFQMADPADVASWNWKCTVPINESPVV